MTLNNRQKDLVNIPARVPPATGTAQGAVVGVGDAAIFVVAGEA
jgi:hypothetical protein